MLPLGHIVLPFFVVERFSRQFSQRKLLIHTSLVFSIFPDIDVLVVGGIAGHHQTLTHTPLFWLLVSCVGLLVAKVLKSNEMQTVLFGVLIGSMSHMFLDTFGMSVGIAWLAPFSRTEYSFLPITAEYATQNWLRHYLVSPAFMIEVFAVVLVGLYYAWWWSSRNQRTNENPDLF